MLLIALVSCSNAPQGEGDGMTAQQPGYAIPDSASPGLRKNSSERDGLQDGVLAREGEVRFGKDVFVVEFARTPKERQKGLMGRESLGDREGLLFVFEDDAPRTFWMKNTLLPLDMIFLDREGVVVHLEENAQPCRKDPCQLYTSPVPARFVLEVKGGVARAVGIHVGDRAVIRSLV